MLADCDERIFVSMIHNTQGHERKVATDMAWAGDYRQAQNQEEHRLRNHQAVHEMGLCSVETKFYCKHLMSVLLIV
jgi:hypothetical protein